MIRRLLSLPVFLVGLTGTLLPPSTAAAQALGTFRWQLQPHCNIVSVTVVQQGGLYLLDGTDDQCGTAERAGVHGLAFLNPDGSIGFGFSIVTAPDGGPVHVSATISLATLSGTWRDSTSDFGFFVFTPGAGTGGPPRPVTLAGDITSVTAGAGLTGGDMSGDALVSVNFAATQQRITGACPGGQLMTAVNQNGTVVCQSVTGAGGGDITAVTAGTGLVGGGTTGEVALSVIFGGTGAAAAAARSDHTHAVAVTNTAVGPLAFDTAGGNNNVAVGRGALRFNGNVNGNTGVGADALSVNAPSRHRSASRNRSSRLATSSTRTSRRSGPSASSTGRSSTMGRGKPSTG